MALNFCFSVPIKLMHDAHTTIPQSCYLYLLPPPKVLSATAEPEEYAERITALLSCHYRYGRDKMLAIARRTATTHQRKALAEVEGA